MENNPLEFYEANFNMLRKGIPAVQSVLKMMEMKLDKEMFKSINRWIDVRILEQELKIEFRYCSKKQFKAIKEFFGIQSWNKKTNDMGHYLYSHYTTKDYNIMTISFYWPLPDTCEIIKETAWEETFSTPDDIKIQDGKVMRKVEKIKEVKCGQQSMLEIVMLEGDE